MRSHKRYTAYMHADTVLWCGPAPKDGYRERRIRGDAAHPLKKPMALERMPVTTAP